MKSPEQRINIIIGQLESLKAKLSSKKADCNDITMQLKAVRSGISSLMQEIIGTEFENCLKRGNSDKIKKLFKEIIK